MRKRFVTGVAALGLVTAFGVIGASPSSASSPTASGQRMMGNTSFSSTTGHFTGGGGSVEPAINDANGSQVYLLTPTKARVHPSTHINPATGMPINVAPIYLPVYPDGSGIDPATVNCAHVPADNCADHGPGVAGGAGPGGARGPGGATRHQPRCGDVPPNCLPAPRAGAPTL